MRNLLLILFLVAAFTASAQTTTECVDELAKDQYYLCTDRFAPVCACDGKTYFNQCDAIHHGGIQGFQYTSGVCGDFDIFMGQSPIDRLLFLYLQFETMGGSITVRIIDIYGNVMSQQFFNSTNSFPIETTISTGSFPAGVYILQAYSSKHQKTIKFSAGGIL